MALTKITGQGVGTVDEVLIQKASSGATATSGTVLTVEDDDNTALSILGGSSSVLALNFGHSGDNNEGILSFNTTSGSEDMLLSSTKDITLRTTSTNAAAGDINFKSYNTTVMHIDGGNNKVGIGTTSPGGKLTIEGTQNSLDSQLKITASGQVSQYMGGSSAVGLALGHDHGSLPIVFKTGVNSGTGVTGSGTERMRITSSGQFVMPGIANDTTSDAANINVRTSDGLVRRSTSSRRYKNTINDATHGLTELLTLRPVTYKGNNDGDTLFGGLIAEEVHDAGLTEFVRYNDDNEPDALAYGHMVSLCVKAIQEQQEVIESLKARITVLEAE